MAKGVRPIREHAQKTTGRWGRLTRGTDRWRSGGTRAGEPMAAHGATVGMRERISSDRGGVTQQVVRSRIIVARDQQDLWRALVDAFKDAEDVQVLLDRRTGERRTRSAPVADERRVRERRSLPRLEDDLHARQYVLVRPHYRRPLD